MATRQTGIRAARPDERDQAIGAIVLGFNSDPTLRWFYPRAGDYVAHIRAFTEVYAGRAFDHGTAYVTEGFEGASLWLPPGVNVDDEAFGRLLMSTVRSEIHGELREVATQIEHFHITEPHWYLPVIAVEPFHHGKGLGGALLAHTLAQIDKDGVPAYLESSNQRNLSLYQRHGFEIIGEIQAGSSPVITPMRRAAR